MASDYKRFFPFMAREADRKGLSKTEFMERSGMPKQSFTKYANGQGITSKTMVNLMEGLALTTEQLEAKSGMRLNKNEKDDLTNAQWLKANAKVIDYLKTHPEEVQKLKRKTLLEI